MKDRLYALHEDIKNKDYVLASYYIRVNASDDILKKAESMALGQTVGTWIKVPGITDKIDNDHTGIIIGLNRTPPFELSTHSGSDKREYILQIAYPTVNFGGNFPMMLTTLLGNDASTSARVKLVDLSFPEAFAKCLGGPRYGVEGLRALFPGRDGPLTMNMIKPCTGISPAQGAKIFYETALGGIDIIKDDELLGNTSFSSTAARVKEYNKAAEAAFERTGKRTLYVCNITDDVSRIQDTFKSAVEAGAKAIMMNYSAIGYSAFSWIARQSPVPVMGHYAVSGSFSETADSGMSSHLSMGKLPRLAGADFAMINTPYGGYPLERDQYIKTYLNLTRPLYSIKAAMPVAGGGVHPGMVPQLIRDLGSNIIIAAGGAVQGHPMGAAAGAKALSEAAAAAAAGLDLREAALKSDELAKALELWGGDTVG